MIAKQMLEDVKLRFDQHLKLKRSSSNLSSDRLNKGLLFHSKRVLFMTTKSILLIEHEASIREILHACLSEFGGWRVTLSNSIQEGVDLCQAISPDVILLDASTSETDALIFLEQLKQYSMTQSIPILLITARASWFTITQLHQMGFAGAIAKPFNPSTLSAQVSQLLGWNGIS